MAFQTYRIEISAFDKVIYNNLEIKEMLHVQLCFSEPEFEMDYSSVL